MTDTAKHLRMLVLCPFPQGVAAGQRLKYEQYFDKWRHNGWDIDVSSYMDMAMWNVVYIRGHFLQKLKGVLKGHFRRLRDLIRIRHYDTVYVFMWVTPFGTSIIERLVRRLARRLIYDVEDNVLVDQALPDGSNPNSILRWIKGRGKTRFLIRKADYVITSSPFLNDLCIEINEEKACTYISSSVDTDRFLPAMSYSNEKPVVIGWTGTFSSRIYLDLLSDVFRRLAERVPFKLKIISNFDYELPGVDLEVVHWTAEREVADLQTFNIGVYPLPINEWVLGKSGLKAIQYMAFGLPCVATEVGTTPMIITDGLNGRLVRTENDWLDALEELVRDPDLRRRLGVQARRDAVANYSLHAIAMKYGEVLKAVLENDR
jgi:glycosyltransferase involved in cell wall biosynthesis